MRIHADALAEAVQLSCDAAASELEEASRRPRRTPIYVRRPTNDDMAASRATMPSNDHKATARHDQPVLEAELISLVSAAYLEPSLVPTGRTKELILHHEPHGAARA